MERRLKLERLPFNVVSIIDPYMVRNSHDFIENKRYTTGDDQKWTYEYTWEDFEMACGFTTTSNHYLRLIEQIGIYFIAHSEKLLEGGRFKDAGLSLEGIRVRLLSLDGEFHMIYRCPGFVGTWITYDG